MKLQKILYLRPFLFCSCLFLEVKLASSSCFGPLEFFVNSACNKVPLGFLNILVLKMTIGEGKV